jgi:hypothetical protein
VGREKGLVVLLEVGLIGIEHAVQPWQKLLGAVVGVEDNGDAVDGCNGADVVCGSDGSGNGSLLVLVVNALTGEVCGTTCDALAFESRGIGIIGSDIPCEVWRMMGDLASRAASREATTVEEEVT